MSIFDDLFSNPAYQPLDLTPAQVYLADQGRPNDDPFDALVCAAARHFDLPLVTRDGNILDSGLVRVIWRGSATAASQLTTVTQKVAPAGALC